MSEQENVHGDEVFTLIELYYPKEVYLTPPTGHFGVTAGLLAVGVTKLPTAGRAASK